MTGRADDPNDPEGPEPATEPAEDALHTWGGDSDEPGWGSIEVEGEPPPASPDDPAQEVILSTAEEDEPEPVMPPRELESPGSRFSKPQPPGPNPYSEIPQEPKPHKSGRLRRPTSLRSAPAEPAASTTSPAPAASPEAAKPPKAKSKSRAKPAKDKPAASVSKPAPASKPPPTPTEPAPAVAPAAATPGTPPSEPGRSLPERIVALTAERPEVGLGVAFAAGLVLATIFKRLGRR